MCGADYGAGCRGDRGAGREAGDRAGQPGCGRAAARKRPRGRPREDATTTAQKVEPLLPGYLFVRLTAAAGHDWHRACINPWVLRVLGTGDEPVADLVVLDRVNPRIKLEAVLTGVPMFVADLGALDELAQDALFAYDDFLRFGRELRESLWKRIEGGLSVAGRRLERARVETYLSQMDEAVGRLAALRKRFTSYEEFEADVDTRELVVHHLRIALECVLDACRHFLTTRGVSLSELDTTNLIELAGDRRLLDAAFARNIRGMAGMRDAIAHVYWRLEYRAIYEIITEKLCDFDDFARQVKATSGRRTRGAQRRESQVRRLPWLPPESFRLKPRGGSIERRSQVHECR